jgi:branched-chain amino acid transport system substrate-binding protein
MRTGQLLRRAAATVVALGVLASAGCEGADPPAAEPVVRLGMLAPLTGPNAPSGLAMKQAAQMAVKEANAAGGVLGRQVELVVGDDACDPGTAVEHAAQLVAEDITVSVGGYCSSATVPSMRIFQAAGVPMIVPVSNSTDLLAPGYDGVFLLSGTVIAEGRFAAGWIGSRGAHRMALVHDGTSFPVTLSDATGMAAAAAGKVRVVGKLELTQGAPGYGRIADAVLAARADAVYFTGYYSEANQLIKDLRTRGFVGLIVLGDGAVDGPVLAGLNHLQVQDVYATALLVPEYLLDAAEWAGRYRAAYNMEPAPSTIEAYDAVMLAVDAIGRAGTVNRARVGAAIAASQGVELVSGPVSFAADGTRKNPRFMLLKARARGFALVREND